MLDKKLWEATEHLMSFVENGVVPRIYEFNHIQYPIWEKAVKANNAWLISTKILEPNNTRSLPHLRAEANGYYIYGFRVDESNDGQAKCELLRYLAGKKSSIQEWTVYAPEENIVTLNSQVNYPEKTEKNNISTKPTSTKNQKQEKQKEKAICLPDTIESPISPAKLPAMPEYSGAEELKDIYNLAKNIFDNVRNNEEVNKYAIGYPILWFGNLQAYKASPLKILTVGINPSKKEFPNNTFRRFPAWNKLSVENYFNGLNEYFNEGAYNWFTQLSNSINLEAVWDCSYITDRCQNTALHIDFCTPIATDPTWKNLPADARKYLQNIHQEYFQKLFNFLNPNIVFIGRKQCEYWQDMEHMDLIASDQYTEKAPEISNMINSLVKDDGTPNAKRNELKCFVINKCLIVTGANGGKPFDFYPEEFLKSFMTTVKAYHSQFDK